MLLKIIRAVQLFVVSRVFHGTGYFLGAGSSQRDLTRPVGFRTPPDTTGVDPRDLESVLIRPARHFMTRESTWLFLFYGFSYRAFPFPLLWLRRRTT